MGKRWVRLGRGLLAIPLVFAGLAVLVVVGVFLVALLALLLLLVLPLVAWSVAGYRGGAIIGPLTAAYYLGLAALACFCPAGILWGPLVFGGMAAVLMPLVLLPSVGDYFARPADRRAAYTALRYASAAGHHPHIESVRIVGTFTNGRVVRLRCGEVMPLARDYAIGPGGACELDAKKAPGLRMTEPPEPIREG